jgi:hypothetical protein
MVGLRTCLGPVVFPPRVLWAFLCLPSQKSRVTPPPKASGRALWQPVADRQLPRSTSISDPSGAAHACACWSLRAVEWRTHWPSTRWLELLARASVSAEPGQPYARASGEAGPRGPADGPTRQQGQLRSASKRPSGHRAAGSPPSRGVGRLSQASGADRRTGEAVGGLSEASGLTHPDDGRVPPLPAASGRCWSPGGPRGPPSPSPSPLSSPLLPSLPSLLPPLSPRGSRAERGEKSEASGSTIRRRDGVGGRRRPCVGASEARAQASGRASGC